MNRLEVPDWDLGHILISQLEQSYGHLAMFFSQEGSAQVIGIKFKKQKVISALSLKVVKRFKCFDKIFFFSEGKRFGG